MQHSVVVGIDATGFAGGGGSNEDDAELQQALRESLQTHAQESKYRAYWEQQQPVPAAIQMPQERGGSSSPRSASPTPLLVSRKTAAARARAHLSVECGGAVGGGGERVVASGLMCLGVNDAARDDDAAVQVHSMDGSANASEGGSAVASADGDFGVGRNSAVLLSSASVSGVPLAHGEPPTPQPQGTPSRLAPDISACRRYAPDEVVYCRTPGGSGMRRGRVVSLADAAAAAAGTGATGTTTCARTHTYLVELQGGPVRYVEAAPTQLLPVLSPGSSVWTKPALATAAQFGCGATWVQPRELAALRGEGAWLAAPWVMGKVLREQCQDGAPVVEVALLDSTSSRCRCWFPVQQVEPAQERGESSAAAEARRSLQQAAAGPGSAADAPPAAAVDTTHAADADGPPPPVAAGVDHHTLLRLDLSSTDSDGCDAARSGSASVRRRGSKRARTSVFCEQRRAPACKRVPRVREGVGDSRGPHELLHSGGSDSCSGGD